VKHSLIGFPTLMTTPSETTETLIERARQGDRTARDRLIERLYEAFRSIAHGRMSQERPDHTLQTTALVNEAIRKLLQERALEQSVHRSRSDVLRAAARAMDQVLIDHARHRNAQKRVGNRARLPIDAVIDHLIEVDGLTVVELREALEALERLDIRAALVVRYRFFWGMSREDVSETLGIAPKTVDRDWAFARAWLYERLRPEEQR